MVAELRAGKLAIRGAYLNALMNFSLPPNLTLLSKVDEGRNRPIPKNFSDRLLELGYIQQTIEDLAIIARARCGWR
jgi:hypothetical protein